MPASVASVRRASPWRRTPRYGTIRPRARPPYAGNWWGTCVVVTPTTKSSRQPGTPAAACQRINESFFPLFRDCVGGGRLRPWRDRVGVEIGYSVWPDFGPYGPFPASATAEGRQLNVAPSRR